MKTYFSQIDTSAKAFFLGSLFADGYVEQNKYHTRTRLEIAEEDKDLLHLFNKHSGQTYPIRQSKKAGTKTFYNGTYQCQAAYMITLPKADTLDLMAYGLLPGKSKKSENQIRFPNIPENLIPHFVRGFFSGDGSLAFRPRDNRWELAFAVSGIFATELRDAIQKGTGALGQLYKDHSINKLVYGRQEDIQKIQDWFYKDCDDLVLTRKYKIYLEMFPSQKI